MASIDDLRNLLAKMRYVKTGDILLADDHNTLVDFAKAATDVLADHENRIASLESQVQELKEQAAAGVVEPFTSTLDAVDVATALKVVSGRSTVYLSASFDCVPTPYGTVQCGPGTSVPLCPSCRRLGLNKPDIIVDVVKRLIAQGLAEDFRINAYNAVLESGPFPPNGPLAVPLYAAAVTIPSLTALSDVYNLALREIGADTIIVGGHATIEILFSNGTYANIVGFNLDVFYDGTSYKASFYKSGTVPAEYIDIDPSKEYVFVMYGGDIDGDGNSEAIAALLDGSMNIVSQELVADDITYGVLYVRVNYEPFAVSYYTKNSQLGVILDIFDKGFTAMLM